MIKKGLWIVITGLDGTGKTTLKRNLAWYYKKYNQTVQDFKFPYDKHLLDLLNNVVGGGQPLKDNYSDQLLFTLDNRILGMQLIPEWKKNFDILISQRGYLDSFVHGECRGFTYEQTDELQKTYELARCDVMIHLNADPEVAFERIKDDPDADKFETLEYIINQAKATEKAFKALEDKNSAMSAFKGIPNIYIDTTHLTCEETFQEALKELKKRGFID